MSPKNGYKDFISSYLARGALGISVGFAVVTPISSATHMGMTVSKQTGSFSDRLSAIRSAVSEQMNGEIVSPQVPRPPLPPRPPPEPFKNFFGKAPFQDTFKNSPPTPLMAAPPALPPQPITPTAMPKLRRAAVTRHVGTSQRKKSLKRMKRDRRLLKRSKS